MLSRGLRTVHCEQAHARAVPSSASRKYTLVIMGFQAVLALIALAPRAFPSATDANGQWMRLVHSNQVSKARALCEPWLTAADRALVAEAHKCLANVELSGAGTIRIEGNASGGTMAPGTKDPAWIERSRILSPAS